MNFVLQKLFNAWFCIPLFCTFSFYHLITTLNSFQWIYTSDIIVFRETFSRSEKPQRRAGIPYLLRRGGKYNISLFVIQKIYLWWRIHLLIILILSTKMKSCTEHLFKISPCIVQYLLADIYIFSKMKFWFKKLKNINTI